MVIVEKLASYKTELHMAFVEHLHMGKISSLCEGLPWKWGEVAASVISSTDLIQPNVLTLSQNYPCGFTYVSFSKNEGSLRIILLIWDKRKWKGALVTHPCRLKKPHCTGTWLQQGWDYNSSFLSKKKNAEGEGVNPLNRRWLENVIWSWYNLSVQFILW